MATKSVKSKDLSRLIRPQVRKLEAYSIDETPCRVKLDAMESPFPMPDNVRQEIAEAVKSAPINRYPDPSAKKLKQAIAGMWGIEPAQTILGNGSDELIQAVILAFGGPVLVPAPTFSMYEITSRALAQDVVAVSLTKDFSLDADKMIGKAKQVKARVIFLASPNNPTGNRFSDEAIMKILDKTNAAVVIDEAYFSFSGKTYLRRMKDHPNMIILRTLSKIGLAGLRIGALTASPGVIAELNKVRLPYNINALSQAAALVVLGHWNTLYEQISLLISERERLYNAMSSMRGVAAYPSETNFILFRTDRDASRVHAKLKQAGILIKDLNRPGPLKNCLRVTVGAPIENNEFLGALRGIVKS